MTITYDFSRASEKRAIISEIDAILSDVLRVSNESARLQELKAELAVINENEKKVVI